MCDMGCDVCGYFVDASLLKFVQAKAKANLASAQRNAKLAQKRQMGANGASAEAKAKNPAKLSKPVVKKKGAKQAVKIVTTKKKGTTKQPVTKVKSVLIQAKKKIAAAVNKKQFATKAAPLEIRISNQNAQSKATKVKTPAAKNGKRTTPATERARKVIMPGAALATAAKREKRQDATKRQGGARAAALASKRGGGASSKAVSAKANMPLSERFKAKKKGKR